MLDVHALKAYDACTMKRRIQYTIRNIPERTDRRLREVAAEYGSSLNEAAVDALSKGAGVADEEVIHHDLDDLASTWVQDDECDAALKAMDTVDVELWK